MPYTHKLQFTKGGTIAGPNSIRPGEQIKKAVDEIQRKSLTDLKSAVPGLNFQRTGTNSMKLVSTASGGKRAILKIRPSDIRNDGAKGDAEIDYVGGVYYLKITFPRVNRTTSPDIGPES